MLPELGGVECIVRGSFQRVINCRANPDYPDEVIEVPGLKCGVLPIVSETEKLTRIGLT